VKAAVRDLAHHAGEQRVELSFYGRAPLTVDAAILRTYRRARAALLTLVAVSAAALIIRVIT
jgi:hypothetical protein